MPCDHAKCATRFCPECGTAIDADAHGWQSLLGWLTVRTDVTLRERDKATGWLAEAGPQSRVWRRDALKRRRKIYKKWSSWAKLVSDHLESMKGTP